MSSVRRVRAEGLRGQSGETLLELLITIVLLGTGIIAILSGLLTLVQTSELTANSTQASLLVQSYAEQLEQPMNASTNLTTYLPCSPGAPQSATVTAYNTTYPATGLPNTNWTVQVVHVDFPTHAIQSQATPDWNDICPATGDIGFQRLYIEAYANTANHPDKEQLVIVKRNQACPAGSADPGPC